MAEKADSALDYYSVASSDELQEGGRLHLDADGKPILLLRVQGVVYAISAICSHEDEPLGSADVEGHEIVCPYHGARFDVRSGEATALPAVVGIPTYPVRERDGQIEIGFPA